MSTKKAIQVGADVEARNGALGEVKATGDGKVTVYLFDGCVDRVFDEAQFRRRFSWTNPEAAQ